MLIITGGAGFIASNLAHALHQAGYEDIVIVDDMRDGHKFVNLLGLPLTNIIDKDDFLSQLAAGQFDTEAIEVIFHLGACSDTTEWDGRYMLANNYHYSRQLLQFSINNHIPFIYASSAAVYGASHCFEEASAGRPLNVYGYSKWLFDQHVTRLLPQSNNLIVGLRFFNVYGPREQHKGSMASVAYHLQQQLQQGDTVKLFAASGGYDAGEQCRDFIHVDDVVAVMRWFVEQNKPTLSGIYNLGTGRAQTFNEVAQAVIAWYGRGEIRYIPFPPHLKDHYQSYTQAVMTKLREAGYDQPMRDVAEGVSAYLDWLARDTAQT